MWQSRNSSRYPRAPRLATLDPVRPFGCDFGLLSEGTFITGDGSIWTVRTVVSMSMESVFIHDFRWSIVGVNSGGVMFRVGVFGEIVICAWSDARSDGKRVKSPIEEDDRRCGRTVAVDAWTSSNSCSWSSLKDVLSESKERRAMIVSRADAARGKAVKMDERARKG